MQSIELTAKSVDEARKTAAEKLGVAPESVQVTVLEETKGLFGKSNVRVRAEAPQASAPAPEPEPVAAAAEAAPAKEEKPKRGRGRSTKAQAEQSGTTETPPETMKEMEQAVDGMAPTEMAEMSANGEDNGAVATEQDAEQLLGLVNEILRSGDLEVTAKARPAGGRYVNVELDGKDVAYLVGKHGEVLNALQYLINISAARKFNNGIRATLDGNNYRERREAALSDLATKIANAVKQRREEAVLDPLPAFERRVVHKALAAIEGIETYSEGEEPNRRVVIAPAEV